MGMHTVMRRRPAMGMDTASYRRIANVCPTQRRTPASPPSGSGVAGLERSGRVDGRT